MKVASPEAPASKCSPKDTPALVVTDASRKLVVLEALTPTYEPVEAEPPAATPFDPTKICPSTSVPVLA